MTCDHNAPPSRSMVAVRGNRDISRKTFHDAAALFVRRASLCSGSRSGRGVEHWRRCLQRAGQILRPQDRLARRAAFASVRDVRRSAVDAYQVYAQSQVDELVALYLGGAGRDKLDPNRSPNWIDCRTSSRPSTISSGTSLGPTPTYVNKLITEDVPQRVAADKAYQNAKQHSDNRTRASSTTRRWLAS